jgi:hypothetical protein
VHSCSPSHGFLSWSLDTGTTSLYLIQECNCCGADLLLTERGEDYVCVLHILLNGTFSPCRSGCMYVLSEALKVKDSRRWNTWSCPKFSAPFLLSFQELILTLQTVVSRVRTKDRGVRNTTKVPRISTLFLKGLTLFNVKLIFNFSHTVCLWVWHDFQIKRRIFS